MNKYYIYVYLDTRIPGTFTYGEFTFPYEPFYVGKGQGRRKLEHLAEAYNNNDVNVHKCRKIRKIKEVTSNDPLIITLFEDLIEDDAIVREIDLISTIGRYDRNQGPLTNKTDGGQTSPSAGSTYEETFGTRRAEEIRKKISKSKTGKKQTLEHRRAGALGRTGLKRSNEAKQNISEALKGKPKTADHIEAMKQGNASKRAKWKLTSPEGETIITEHLQDFAFEHNLVYRELLKISQRTEENKHIHRAKRHRGWECSKID